MTCCRVTILAHGSKRLLEILPELGSKESNYHLGNCVVGGDYHQVSNLVQRNAASPSGPMHTSEVTSSRRRAVCVGPEAPSPHRSILPDPRQPWCKASPFRKSGIGIFSQADLPCLNLRPYHRVPGSRENSSVSIFFVLAPRSTTWSRHLRS